VHCKQFFLSLSVSLSLSLSLSYTLSVCLFVLSVSVSVSLSSLSLSLPCPFNFCPLFSIFWKRGRYVNERSAQVNFRKKAWFPPPELNVNPSLADIERISYVRQNKMIPHCVKVDIIMLNTRMNSSCLSVSPYLSFFPYCPFLYPCFFFAFFILGGAFTSVIECQDTHHLLKCSFAKEGVTVSQMHIMNEDYNFCSFKPIFKKSKYFFSGSSVAVLHITKVNHYFRCNKTVLF
jgi:hypothetical protein